MRNRYFIDILKISKYAIFSHTNKKQSMKLYNRKELILCSLFCSFIIFTSYVNNYFSKENDFSQILINSLEIDVLNDYLIKSYLCSICPNGDCDFISNYQFEGVSDVFSFLDFSCHSGAIAENNSKIFEIGEVSEIDTIKFSNVFENKTWLKKMSLEQYLSSGDTVSCYIKFHQPISTNNTIFSQITLFSLLNESRLNVLLFFEKESGKLKHIWREKYDKLSDSNLYNTFEKAEIELLREHKFLDKYYIGSHLVDDL